MTDRRPGGVSTDEDATADPGAMAILAAVTTQLGSFVESFEPARFSGADAARLVGSFSKIERLALAGKTLAAHRAAEARVHQSTGHRNSAESLAAQTGDSVGDCLDMLRIGENLATQPGVEDSLRKGRLTRAKAKSISGAVKENPEAESSLVDNVETTPLDEVRERAGAARGEAHASESDEEREERLRRLRFLKMRRDMELGMLRLSGLLTPLEGAKLKSLIETKADQIFQAAFAADIHDDCGSYVLDALLQLLGIQPEGCWGGRTTPVDGSGDPTDADAPVTDAGADAADADTADAPAANSDTDRPGGSDADPATEPATTEPATFDLVPAPTDLVPTPQPPRPPGRTRTDVSVHVRVDLQSLRAGHVRPGDVCEIPGVGPISLRAAKELMGDALVKVVITDGIDVTTVCTLKRHIPAPIAAALLERDPVCVVPGCRRSQHLEVDHWQVDFAKGGPTAWWNLCHLCQLCRIRHKAHYADRRIMPTGVTWDGIAAGQAA